jgi:hypothetical protein
MIETLRLGATVALVITIGVENAGAAEPYNPHDNVYEDDYAHYAAERPGMDAIDRYNELMLWSMTAQYCADTFDFKGGSEWPGSYWGELARVALTVASISHEDGMKLYRAFAETWDGADNPSSYRRQFDAEPTRVKLQECPATKEPEFRDSVN